MPVEQFELSAVIPASAERLYHAWLDSAEHAGFTGSPARIESTIGGVFQACDGYISGRNLALTEGFRIVQSWRTSEFPEGHPDSILEISLEDAEDGTLVTLEHRAIPEGQGEGYRQGWREHYFEPMKAYFGRRG